MKPKPKPKPIAIAIAVGYTADGTKKEFEIINGVLDCRDSILVSIDCGEAKVIYCSNNHLTSLDAPLATWIDCSYNHLTSLNAPLATWINCNNNQFDNPKTGIGVFEAREFILRRVLLPKNIRRTKRKMPRRRIS